MKKVALLAGALALVAVVAAGAWFAHLQREAARWSGPFREIVEEELTHEEGETHSRFVTILDAPVERVQAAVWDLGRLGEIVPNFRIAKVLEERGDTKRVELGIQALTLPLMMYEMEFTNHPDEQRIAFRTVRSQAQDIEGEYRLEASPDGRRTRVTYVTVARDKIAVPFPRSVLDTAGRETFVNTVRGFQKLLQEP